MDRMKFRNLVKEALVDLPTEFAAKLDNVAVVIEDHPTEEQREARDGRSDTVLFGLYEGVPRTERGGGYTMVLPDKITIFQKSFEKLFDSEEEVRREVRSTVLHEIGHHFGLREKDL